MKPKIIYLEGVSSSGKTTLARELQKLLPTPFFLVAGDTFWEMAPPLKTFDNEILFPKVEAATINVMKLLPDLGIDIIIDFVPVGREYLANNFAKALSGFSVLYVNVICPIEELRRRETSRGDREIGLAENQLSQLNPPESYDLAVDTAYNTPRECAEIIIKAFENPENFTAFKKLKEN